MRIPRALSLLSVHVHGQDACEFIKMTVAFSWSSFPSYLAGYSASLPLAPTRIALQPQVYWNIGLRISFNTEISTVSDKAQKHLVSFFLYFFFPTLCSKTDSSLLVPEMPISTTYPNLQKLLSWQNWNGSHLCSYFHRIMHVSHCYWLQI